MPPDLHVVTGAFGYSGRFITERLLAQGHQVRTLTNHPRPGDPLFVRVQSVPFKFDAPARLAENLQGARVLINNYWVRFNYGDMTHDRAVRHSETLIRAAVETGVQRIVHVSIANPSEDSPLSYYRGKAKVERIIIDSGLSYAILRPTVLFGGLDILLNNIAWLLRRSPVFAVFGMREYGIQPVHVDDLASVAVEMAGRSDNVIMDAVGPETYPYPELVRLIARSIGRKARIVRIPAFAGWLASKAMGLVVGDVIVTRDEISGLMSNLLVSKNPPTCPTRLSEWLAHHGQDLGKEYRSELARHFK